MDIYAVAAFVNARLDEAEADAHACGDAPWELLHEARQVNVSAEAIRNEKWKYGQMGYVASFLHREDGRHVARHDPARVLVEVATTRSIVSNMCSLHEGAWQYDDARTAVEHLTLTTVRRLAQLDADHADYDPEWSL